MTENPLRRALDDASSSPEGRAYTVPVELVRRKAWRRRARRAAGTAAVAVVVVGGVGGGVAAGAGAWRDGGSGLSGASAGDWPGQFMMCGKPVDEVLPPPLSSARLVLDPLTAALPADGDWATSVTTEVPVAGEDLGWIWGTDLLVVRDGVVVGVQDGPQVPLAEDLDEYLAGAAPSFATAPFPLVSDVSMGLASCDQYPDGQGSPRLEPGTYDFVVAQTVSYLRQADNGRVDLRLGAETTVTITAPGATPATGLQPIACGASADDLAALASPEANPQAFPIEAEVTGEALVGQPLPIGFSIPTGAADFLGDGFEILDARALLTQEGVVVGDAEPVGDGGAVVTVGVPQDCRAREAATSEPEDGFPLAAGEYDVWFVFDGRPLNTDGPDIRVAGGPWPVTLNDEAHTRALAFSEAERTLFRCAEPVDRSTVGDDSGLTLDTSFPAGIRGWVPPPWPGTIAATDGRTHEVWVGPWPSLVVLDGAGLVVGFAYPAGWGEPVAATIRPDAPAHAEGSDVWTTFGCGPDGLATLAGAEEGFKGPHRAVPYVVVDAGDGPVVLLGEETDAPFAPM